MSELPILTVGALIIAPDGDVLIVKSHKWNNLYTVPGGKVDLNETREAALHREIFEETQLKIVNIRAAILQECIFSPEFYLKKHFLMSDYIADLHPSYQKEQVLLNNEAQQFLWIKPLEALNLPLQHETRVLLEWYLNLLSKNKKMGLIGIKNHQIHCKIGVYPEEHLNEQIIYVDLKIKSDFSACIQSENIQEGIDYCELAKLCTDLATERHYCLLESLASDILNHCMQLFKPEWAWISIRKPEAIKTAEYAYIELERYSEKST